MRTLVFQNKIIKELMIVHERGERGLIYTRGDAKIFAKNLVSTIKQGRKKSKVQMPNNCPDGCSEIQDQIFKEKLKRGKKWIKE